MGNILYIIAIVFLVLWAVGYFAFEAGQLIHILIVVALIALVVRLLSGNKLIK